MLNDKYDESLVVLKRRFCWSYTDIFYTKQIVTNSANKSHISEEQRLKLLTGRRNLGDQLLYEKMREKWLLSPELHEDDFEGEVSEIWPNILKCESPMASGLMASGPMALKLCRDTW